MLPRLKFLSFQLNDQQIIQDVLQGGITGRKAEDLLFSKYSYYIDEGIKKYSILSEESFDVYSDAILSVINAIISGTFEERSSLKTYIFRIFNNKCVDVVRRNTTNKHGVNRTVDVSDLLGQLSDTSKSIIQQLVDRNDMEQMRNRLANLSEGCQQLLMMFAEGYSDKEIAKELDYKTPEVVKTSRLRCMQKLKQVYPEIKRYE